MKKKILLIITIAATSAIVTGIFFFKKTRPNLKNIQPALTITAIDFYTTYQQDEIKANAKFLDKVIEVKGVVESTQQTDTTLSIQLKGGETGGINCSIATNREIIKPPLKGAVVIIKGKCSGFLMDINLSDCVIK